jgi:hypothetical protein
MSSYICVMPQLAQYIRYLNLNTEMSIARSRGHLTPIIGIVI